MKKSTKSLVIFVVVAVPTILCSYWYMFAYSQEKAFRKMELGDNLEKLLNLAGGPSYETDGLKWVEPEFERAESEKIPGCIKELWYKAKLFPLPSKWSYCFNEENKLLHKYHWVSW